jgi:hypothetical protein
MNPQLLMQGAQTFLPMLTGGQQQQQQQSPNQLNGVVQPNQQQGGVGGFLQGNGSNILGGAITGGMMGGPVGALAGGALSLLPSLFGGNK